ncbi:Protein of unknown function [Pyronema omphalodes CBS 100304]|uniref:Uncharacterized protein n=1 Tax=Pyronema omphalodes (strain CBS 100304) TaxID=1076935 RepID=U4LM53_PYROM|nr:Protein of unknown function [Pyronema omphalodes CBS 100304]
MILSFPHLLIPMSSISPFPLKFPALLSLLFWFPRSLCQDRAPSCHGDFHCLYVVLSNPNGSLLYLGIGIDDINLAITNRTRVHLSSLFRLHLSPSYDLSPSSQGDFQLL